jgi:hypothetical protein
VVAAGTATLADAVHAGHRDEHAIDHCAPLRNRTTNKTAKINHEMPRGVGRQTALYMKWLTHLPSRSSSAANDI